jgi:hypothetical protein
MIAGENERRAVRRGWIAIAAAVVAAGVLGATLPALGRTDHRARDAAALRAQRLVHARRLRHTSALVRQRQAALRARIRAFRSASAAQRRALRREVRSILRRAATVSDTHVRGLRLLAANPMRVWASPRMPGAIGCPRQALPAHPGHLNAAAAAALLAVPRLHAADRGSVDRRGAGAHALLEAGRDWQPPHACGDRIAERTMLVELHYPRVATVSLASEELWLVRRRGGWQIWGSI